jgi:LCP family protein required for cell wall assembly
MDPNEPFDYDRLDALLRDIGYEEPTEDDLTAAQPAPQAQPTAQTAQSVRRTAAQQPRSQASVHTQPAPAPQQPRPTQPVYRTQPQQTRSAQPTYAAQNTARAPQPKQTTYNPPPAPPQPPQEPAPEAKKPKKKRKHRFLKFLLVLLVILIVAVVVLLKTNVAQPISDESLGARKTGCSTILLAGTDAGGTRTDTIMLCTINAVDGSVSLLSIPRDTLVNDSYSVPKINGTYGVYGCGEDGMEALMRAVEKLIGYRPDGYVLVDLDGFVDLVDLMGGVEFDVPVDMYYNDPSQDLYIDLDEGLQTLTGEEAMGVVRYRSGYALADLQRVSVQRDFLSACLNQWVTVKNIFKAPKLLPLAIENVTTDMSYANLIWCAGALLRCDTSEIATNTLPGSASMWNGGSYYIESPSETVDLINELYNPYAVDVSIYDLDVRTP